MGQVETTTKSLTSNHSCLHYLNYAINVDTQVMNEVRRIEREKATALKSIEDTLSERLLAIGADRSTLERQKAEQKYDALQQSISAQRAASQAYQQALFDASSFKSQQESLCLSG